MKYLNKSKCQEECYLFKKEKKLPLQTIRELTDTKIIPDYIYQRRNILVKEGIITDKRVIECSTEKILIEKDYIDDKTILKENKEMQSCPFMSNLFIPSRQNDLRKD